MKSWQAIERMGCFQKTWAFFRVFSGLTPLERPVVPVLPVLSPRLPCVSLLDSAFGTWKREAFYGNLHETPKHTKTPKHTRNWVNIVRQTLRPCESAFCAMLLRSGFPFLNCSEKRASKCLKRLKKFRTRPRFACSSSSCWWLASFLSSHHLNAQARCCTSDFVISCFGCRKKSVSNANEAATVVWTLKWNAIASLMHRHVWSNYEKLWTSSEASPKKYPSFNKALASSRLARPLQLGPEMHITLRLPTPPMETPDPPSDTPGASKQVVLTPHEIPRSLRVVILWEPFQVVKDVKLPDSLSLLI